MSRGHFLTKCITCRPHATGILAVNARLPNIVMLVKDELIPTDTALVHNTRHNTV